MSRHILLATIVIFLSWLVVPLPSHADIRGLPSITVLAASSMTDAMTELARVYSKEKGITVTATYGASSDLAEQIADGEDADVFISSHPQWISHLKQLGLLDVYSVTNLVKNSLVFAAAKGSYLDKTYPHQTSLKPLLELLASRKSSVATLVTGDPQTVPLGIYAKQALKQLGVWKALQPMLVPTANSREALYLIAKGSNAGIIYASDAFNNREVTIISPIDERLHEPIIYQGAVVAGESMAYARSFLEFLKTPQAKEIFKKHGFVVG